MDKIISKLFNIESSDLNKNLLKNNGMWTTKYGKYMLYKLCYTVYKI